MTDQFSALARATGSRFRCGRELPAAQVRRTSPVRAAITAGAGTAWAVAPAGLVGAATVHELEYHLGLGDTAGHMLTACPVRGGLLLVTAFAMATVLLIWRELRGLKIERASLTATVGTSAVPVSEVPRRSGARLLVLLGAILATQAGIYTLVQHLWPMIGMMRMSGVPMRMPIDGALPLVPVQLVVAAALALVVWRLERRVARMRAAIAALRELLRNIPVRRPRPRHTGPSIGSCWMQAGLLGFSRPPPLAH